MTRRGASLLELVVVLAIMATILGLLLPATQKARARSLRTACANNLRQIGIAIHSSYGTQSQLPYARECPGPWRNGNDLHCETLPSPDYYTSPQEQWWAPYDNRPGTKPTQSLPDFSPGGFLWDFVGKSPQIFRCPEGVDRTLGSSTYGQFFQVSYAIDPQIGGRRLNDPNLNFPLAWEHDDLPVCRFSGPHWALSPADSDSTRHLPQRHLGRTNTLHRNCSVSD